MQLERTAQVWGISGNLGGGKTLSAVEIAVRSIASGYLVATNIDLDIDLICSELGEWARPLYRRIDLENDDPMTWPCGDPRGSGGDRRVLVVIDEVAEWFDQYASTSPAVRRFLSWLRHSSKRSQDVFLIVQRREYLAKSLRILVARWIWVEDLAVFRIPKLRIKLPFCGGYVARSFFDRLGNSVQPLEFCNKRRWGRYYNTAQLLTGQGLGAVYDRPKRPAKQFPDVVFWGSVAVWAFTRLFAV